MLDSPEYNDFVEKSKECIEILNKNLKEFENNFIVTSSPVDTFIKSSINTYDIVFYDPPFEFIIDTHSLLNIDEGETIELSVKAYDTSENESALSSSVNVYLDNLNFRHCLCNPLEYGFHQHTLQIFVCL
mgnify:CR=1 FL=1